MKFLCIFVVLTICSVTEGLSQSQSRIIQGQALAKNANPYLIAIRVLKRNGKLFDNIHCNGVVLSKKWVLSLAHCFEGVKAKRVLVYAGEHDLEKVESEESKHEVKRIIIHENFKTKKTGMDNDIALLELKDDQHIVLSPDYVSKIAFNGASDWPEDDHECRVSGWGTTSYNNYLKDKYPGKPREAVVEVVNQAECEAGYDDLDPSEPVTDNMICAGGNGGPGACFGDCGGPLVCENELGQDVVVGLVSFGKECGRGGLPDVYTRISEYLDWIKEKTGLTQQDKVIFQ